jgi:hypothetical protein
VPAVERRRSGTAAAELLHVTWIAVGSDEFGMLQPDLGNAADEEADVEVLVIAGLGLAGRHEVEDEAALAHKDDEVVVGISDNGEIEMPGEELGSRAHIGDGEIGVIELHGDVLMSVVERSSDRLRDARGMRACSWQ